MLNILIPTDFTVPSLDAVKNAAIRFAGNKLNIVLFHALHTPANSQEQFFTPRQKPAEKLTETFRHTCAAIKRKHSRTISQIAFRHMYGSTPDVFRNFLELNHIQVIYMPEHMVLSQAYENSVAPLPLFKMAGIPFITDKAALAEAGPTTVPGKLPVQNLERNTGVMPSGVRADIDNVPNYKS